MPKTWDTGLSRKIESMIDVEVRAAVTEFVNDGDIYVFSSGGDIRFYSTAEPNWPSKDSSLLAMVDSFIEDAGDDELKELIAIFDICISNMQNALVA